MITVYYSESAVAKWPKQRHCLHLTKECGNLVSTKVLASFETTSLPAFEAAYPYYPPFQVPEHPGEFYLCTSCQRRPL